MKKPPSRLRPEKLGALYWKRLKARSKGDDMFVVAREVLSECLAEFDSRVLADNGATLGADLLRRFSVLRGVSVREVLRMSTGSAAESTSKNLLQRGEVPSLLKASQIELYTGGMVPMESWLFGGTASHEAAKQQARQAQAKKLRITKSVVTHEVLRVRHHILLALKKWLKVNLPPRYQSWKAPKYRVLKEYAVAKGFLDAQERFYERCAPSATVAEDYRVLCAPGSNTPIPPGDYDAALEHYSLVGAELRAATAEGRRRRIEERLRKIGRAPRDGTAVGNTGAAGPERVGGGPPVRDREGPA
jgi:hypothetical protein